MTARNLRPSQPGAIGEAFKRIRILEATVGGGGLQTAWEQIVGDPVTIADGGSSRLTWNNKILGSDLLDLSTPDLPTVVQDGVYAVTCTVYTGGSMTLGGYYRLSLYLDESGNSGSAQASFPVTTFSVQISVIPLVFFIPAGGTVALYVANGDGVNAVDFNLQVGVVQRLR